MELISFNGKVYPKFQSIGNAAQFAIPYAKHFCNGIGVDVGCNNLDWKFPGAFPIDPEIDKRYHAMKFPDTHQELDYVFSSHCLEHIPNWVDVLDYWVSKLKVGGTLFLYLPDYSQEYWRPWNNRKHINIFTTKIIKDYLIHKNFINIFESGVDLNNAFMVVGQKNYKF